MDFKIELVGITIAIHSLYEEVFGLCKDYLSEGEEAFSVHIAQSDIDFEREKSMREAAIEGIPCFDYPAPYLETLAVYRKIAVKLLDFDILLLHGSAVCVGAQAFLFTAPSGVGKTTHSRLWLENIAGAFIINGDKPLVKSTDEGCIVYGTPWSGKEGINQNTSAPLQAVCFLERGEKNKINKMNYFEIIPFLLQQAYRPDSAEAMEKTMDLVKKFGGKVNFYKLRCNMEPEAARIAYEGMKSE